MVKNPFCRIGQVSCSPGWLLQCTPTAMCTNLAIRVECACANAMQRKLRGQTHTQLATGEVSGKQGAAE